MSRLNTRLTRLEALKPKSGQVLIAGLAVERWPERPDAERFFTDLMVRHGWKDIGPIAVFVIPGPDAIMFEPVKLERVNAETERVWLDATDVFPQARIHGDGTQLLVVVHESQADVLQWLADAERTLAMEA